jgi:hypothetical protein
MHEIDMMLDYQLKGEQEQARLLSDKLENLGPNKILDPKGENTTDIWYRHCFNRGWFLLQDGDYQEGCKRLEHGRFLNVYGSPPLNTEAPIYNPEVHDIKGKSIIISLEGGYGDEMIHARFAKSYKNLGAKKVYIATVPQLKSIFSRIPGVDEVILRNQSHTVQHDYWVPGFSAGWVAGHTFDNFPSDPYMTPNMESVRVWKNVINSEKIKVGIRWAGNPKFEHQQFRRFPENFITNLSKYEELQIYSLQRDHNLVSLPENVIDLQFLLMSWEDTMAAIANMDLIITSCTSIAHLSAAMGKETWVIVPILPYHTWTYKSPESKTSPYYKSARLFRQKKYQKWNEAFQQLYSELEDKFSLNHIDMPNEDIEPKKLNLGCGFLKLNGFVNVDKSPIVQPDQHVDLNISPWPWKDNEFDHIVAKDILEHIDIDFVKIIKEMYRISTNGAIWEVSFPHWRCDTSLDDPTHRRLITIGSFNLFNKNRVLERVKENASDSLLAFEEDIDIEICDTKFEYTEPYAQRIKNKSIKEDELNFALNHLNNVALSVRVLIQVHKPGRSDMRELKEAIASR